MSLRRPVPNDAPEMGLERHLTAAIAPESVDWARVESATYRIDQRFCYTYPGPIRNLRHRLVLSPPARHGTQERLAREMTFAPAFASARALDAFGNEVVTLAVPRVEAAFDITFVSLVRTHAGPASYEVESPNGSTLFDPAPFALGLHTPRGLTAGDDAMREIAFELRQSHDDDEARARAISRFVFERIAYTKDSTDVSTTAIQAFHTRRGVCQDFAHVALALGRCAGLACRYVSGHMLGEGGTHAWVEFLVPAGPQGRETAPRLWSGPPRTRVVALDPTHDRDVSMRYVTVAVGRDYADVAPTSGAYDAPYAGTFVARHAVSIAAVTYA